MGTPFWLPVWTLAQREVVRFFRQRSRVVGALGHPLFFWILFGVGLGGSFKAPAWVANPETYSYQEYFFPGIAVLILLFTAIFSTISIIEDRREGFLQGVLVSPIPRLALVLGKVSGGTVLAVLQAVLFLVIGPALHYVGMAPAMELEISLLTGVQLFGWLTLVAFALTALGYVIAWPMDSTQGFHAIMSIFLMPMWLLSGAFFPGGESGWMSWIIRLNPLTYGVAGLRHILAAPGQIVAGKGLPAFSTCLLVTLLFSVICLALAVWLTRRRTSTDAR